ncbi:MAG: hypothetical protein M3Y57_22945 [Acidobacteriota bacterium]|nr:hypothetical protein [Acidobacteriota bacterium]
MRLNDSRWIAYWYFSIGVGFVLLAIYNGIIGGKLWLIGIRVIIAVGFALLGWMELRGKARKR